MHPFRRTIFGDSSNYCERKLRTERPGLDELPVVRKEVLIKWCRVSVSDQETPEGTVLFPGVWYTAKEKQQP
jgi:hypothetical protein